MPNVIKSDCSHEANEMYWADQIFFEITLKFKTRMNCSNKEVYVTANTQQIKNLIHASFKMSFQTLQLQFKAIKIVMK